MRGNPPMMGGGYGVPAHDDTKLLAAEARRLGLDRPPDSVARAATMWGADVNQLREDLDYLFALTTVDSLDGGASFDLYATSNSGRLLRRVPASRAFAIMTVRWGPGGSPRKNAATGAP